MSREDDFRYIYEEIKVFHRNLGKDNSDRRSNLDITQKYINKLDRIKNNFSAEINKYHKEVHKQDIVEQTKSYISTIEKYIVNTENILKARLDSSSITTSSSDESSLINKDRVNIVKYEMSEKFNLKTAAAIIPLMDSSEDTIKAIIDAIELYDSLLDSDGKKLLTKYVLKARISESAKLRLEKSYLSNQDLINDIKSRLLTKKSAAALSLELHNMKQNRKSIDQYGKSIEDLMVNLTLAQSNGNDNAATVLAEANEKIAINAFANGLVDNDLRIIIKSRNFARLNDAIRAAQDEDNSKKNNGSQVFHLRGRTNNFRGFRNQGYRGNSNNWHRGTKHYFSNKPAQENSNYRNANRPNRGQGYYRGNNQKRVNFRGTQNTKTGFHIQNGSNDNEAGPSTSGTDGRFFRPSL